MKQLWALAIVFVLAAPVPASADGTQLTRESQVDALFSSWTTTTPGCAVGVAQDGKIALEQAYGMADLEHNFPNTPDSIFEAGSVSKQFTAAAVLLLARDGKLSLDDSVRKYVPELPDYATPITLRQMLQHTSGLRDWGSVESIAGWPRGTRVYTHAHVLDILSRQRALNFLPGTRWSYSNSGYNLAAIIVSRVSGESFAEFTRKRLFEPLGMLHTSWRDDYTRIVKGRTVAYAEAGGGYRTDMPFENVHGNGGLLTTVGDLLRWNLNFVEPKVGDAAYVQELQTPGRLSGGQEYDYAYGLRIGEYQGLREVSHSGTTASYRAFLARYPDQQFSVAVLCNAGNSTPRHTEHAVADIYLGAALKPPPKPVSASLSVAELDALAGMYRNIERGDVVTILRDGQILRFEGETPLIALTRLRFTDGEGAVIEFDGQGGGRIDDGSGAPIRLKRVQPARPATDAMEALAASYTSDEAETVLTVELREGALVLTQRPDRTYTLTPLYADAFGSDIGTIIFRRDETGRPVALSVVEDRVWDLRFQRASGTAASAHASVTIPIELTNNFPVLEVTIGDKHLPVMFDLGGSDEIVLSTEALKSLQVEPLAETYAWVDVRGNRLESRRFIVPELHIGSLVFRDVTGHEDAEAATYRKTPTGVGYIGAALIRPFKLVVDYGQRSMTFVPKDMPDPEHSGCFGTEIAFDPAWDGDPVTKAVTDLGELVFVWDTGAPMSLVRVGLVKARGLVPDGLHVRTEKFMLGGKDFGPMQLRPLNFTEPAGVDGFVGHDFFASHVVCIDFGGKKLLVHPNA